MQGIYDHEIDSRTSEIPIAVESNYAGYISVDAGRSDRAREIKSSDGKLAAWPKQKKPKSGFARTDRKLSNSFHEP